MKGRRIVASLALVLALAGACAGTRSEVIAGGAGREATETTPSAQQGAVDAESDVIEFPGTPIEGAESMPLRELAQRVLGSEPDVRWRLYDPDEPLTHATCEQELTPSIGELEVTSAEAMVQDACYMAADYGLAPWQALIELDHQDRAGAFTSRWRTDYPDEFDVAMNLTVRWNGTVPPEVMAEARASGLPFRFEQSSEVTAIDMRRASKAVYEALLGMGIRHFDYWDNVTTRTVHARIGQALIDGVPIDRKAVEAALPRRSGITYDIQWKLYPDLDPSEVPMQVVDRFVVAFIQMANDNANFGTLRIGDECIWIEFDDPPVRQTLVFAYSEQLWFDASIPAVVNGDHVMRDGDDIVYGGSATGHISEVGDNFLTLPHPSCPATWHIAVGPGPSSDW